MLTLNVDTLGLQKFVERIDGFSQRRMNAAIATALTRTARDARDDIKAMLPNAIDRPTPYTMRGVFFRGANAQTLEAKVWFNNEFGGGTPQNRYLYPQVYGGTRNTKRFEKALMAKGSMPRNAFAVPTSNTKKDGYGNIDKGQLAQIISQVGTELVSGHTRSISKDKLKRKAAFGRAGGQFFAVPQQKGKLSPGIYLAEGRNFGRMGYGRNGRIKAILLFKTGVRYNKRVPFYETANKKAAEVFNKHLSEAVFASMMRLQASRG